MIKPAVSDSVSFLQQHIQEDLAQLTKILGKSVDETINILHLVLGSLLKDPQQHPGQCKETTRCPICIWGQQFFSCFANRHLQRAVDVLMGSRSLRLVSYCRE